MPEQDDDIPTLRAIFVSPEEQEAFLAKFRRVLASNQRRLVLKVLPVVPYEALDYSVKDSPE
jgi:hypothetical protein